MAKELFKTSMAVGLLILSSSTVCSAKVLHQKPAKLAEQAQTSTPELAAADERVGQAKNQLATAKKQLDAAKALLKAAAADFKAARAEQQALSLKTTAQGLADASGLQASTNAKGSGVDIASRNPGTASQKKTESNQSRIQQLDFNAEPSSVTEPVQLR